jgi:hypothetical protein
MISHSFHHAIDFWIAALDTYSISQLLTKPSPSSWSIGQVYMHLIENTDWFFEQVKSCISCDDNSDKESSPEGKQMLLKNEFPDFQLQGPPDNDFTAQPKSKKDILDELKRQKREVKALAEAIRNSRFAGKTQHPGLQYFNAAEWFQFAEMHLRHHMRQKKRIDEFLAKEASKPGSKK